MYTLPKDTEITYEVIKGIIDYNESLKLRYDKLDAYYAGKQSILERKKDTLLSNNKVMVNHAKYIVDTNVGYLMGNPVEYQVGKKKGTKEPKYNLDPLLDEYKRQTMNDIDTEIARDTSIFGLQYEYVFANENAEPRSAEVDNRNTVLVYDDTIAHNKLFGVMYHQKYTGEKEKKKLDHYEVTYCNPTQIIKYKCPADKGELTVIPQEVYDESGNTTIENEAEHYFGDVPLIEYRNNPDYCGDFEQVITLIDAYNLLQSDRINDKEQLVDAILAFSGMEITSEQMDMLRSDRVLSNLPVDGDVKYIIKTLNEADTDVLRKVIENDIHKISMTPNMSDENFIGNSSGVAIRYKLLAFEQNISNKERYLEKGLMERFKMYNHFLFKRKGMEIIPIEEVDAVFKRNLPSNDFEISQMINNLAGLVDRDTLIAQLSFITNAQEIAEIVDAEEKAKPKPSFDKAYESSEPDDEHLNDE